MRGLLHLDVRRSDELTRVPRQAAPGELLDDGPSEPAVLLHHRNDWLVELLELALEERGVPSVRATGTEVDALASLARSRPAVLLVSERLPGGSGLSVVEQARALSPSTLCVVQLEADGNLPVAVASGAAAVLSRGVSVPDLVGLLATLVPAPGIGVGTGVEL